MTRTDAGLSRTTWLQSILDKARIQVALAQGIRDENKLTNLVFFARYPERHGRGLERGEPRFRQLSQEWLDIRKRLVQPALRALQTRRAPTAVSKDVIVKGGKWGGWKGRQTKGTAFISASDVSNTYDLAVAVAARVETGGAFDKVQMYDKGILSWGIKQWTLHRGSLQGILGFIKRKLAASGQSTLWSELFPRIDIQANRIVVDGTAYSTPRRDNDPADLALRRILRGKEKPEVFDKDTLDNWLVVFARAGRHPEIRKLQLEYALESLKNNVNKHLGRVLESRHDIKESEIHNYRRVGDYVESSPLALALFNGMETQNPKWTYRYLKRIVDRFARRYETHDTSQWPSGWRDEFAQELKREFQESGVACWGNRAIRTKPRCQRRTRDGRMIPRTSRTVKILNAYKDLSRYL